MRRLTVAIILAVLAPLIVNAQERADRAGEWRYIGADAAHTRYSPLDQINAENFGDLEVAWIGGVITMAHVRSRYRVRLHST